MTDFKIDVGFNTDELKRATSGVSGGGTGGGGGGAQEVTGLSKGIKAALAATGIIGFLAALRPILDTIGFLIGIIAAAMGFLISQLIQWIVPFFKDPFRALLSLGLFIVNGVLAGLEILINVIAGIFSLGKVGGFGDNKIELPRFQEEIILEAYDNVNEVAKALNEGKSTASDLKQAQQDYKDSFFDSLLTNAEFKEIKDAAEQNNQSYKETLDALGNNTDNLDSFFTNATDTIVNTATTAFNKLGEALDFISSKADDFLGNDSGPSFTPISIPQFQNISNVAGGGLGQTTVVPEFIQREQDRVSRELGFD